MDSEENGGGGATNHPSSFSPMKESSTKKEEFIGFTAELTSDRVLSKLRELNGEEDKAGHQFTDEDLVKIGYLLDRVAMLDVKVIGHLHLSLIVILFFKLHSKSKG